MVTENKLSELFLSLQNELSIGLSSSRQHIRHPSALGDVSESKWREWLERYLPKRYAVEKGFLVDSDGKLSEQIDVIIYDRQYSPFIFSEREVKYIPVESVYCIFEVKQSMNKSHIEYASGKASSIDSLKVTSTSFNAITGVHKKEPFRILRGILTTDSEWTDGNVTEIFKDMILKHQIDLGCTINDRSFSNENGILKISEKDECLIFFFLKLLSRLTELGTVPALSIEEYAKSLKSRF